jgi:hypothetical protein
MGRRRLAAIAGTVLAATQTSTTIVDAAALTVTASLVLHGLAAGVPTDR